MVEKSGVEKFLLALGLKSSWLKSLGLKGLGLKLGVEKSRVEMSFNRVTYVTKKKKKECSFKSIFIPL